MVRQKKSQRASRKDSSNISLSSPSQPRPSSSSESQAQSTTTSTGISCLRQNKQLWYKICVLNYDLVNLRKDYSSEKRTLSTTDELYISEPYFTPKESLQIKSAIRSTLDSVAEDAEEGMNISDDLKTQMTVEEAIKSRLSTFFEKRRASGDARPCGPHDMAPIYQQVFGIQADELKDDQFLSRMRRTGLGK